MFMVTGKSNKFVLCGCQVYPFPIPDLFCGNPLVVSGRFHGKFPRSIKVVGMLPDQTVWDVEVFSSASPGVPLSKVSYNSFHLQTISHHNGSGCNIGRAVHQWLIFHNFQFVMVKFWNFNNFFWNWNFLLSAMGRLWRLSCSWKTCCDWSQRVGVLCRSLLNSSWIYSRLKHGCMTTNTCKNK